MSNRSIGRFQFMLAAPLRRGLVMAAVTATLTAVAQSNSWLAAALAPPDVQLRTFYSGSTPPEPQPVVIHAPSKPDPPRPPAAINAELLSRDVPRHYYEDSRYYVLSPPDVPAVRYLNAVFEPEEFKIGRTATLSSSLLTAIKRKDPLCLLNPIFFQISW